MEKGEVLISWLSEFDYCPRRFWLKAMEKQEGDNQDTAEGSMAHQHVHGERVEKRREKIKVTGLHVRSDKYNLYGICDCVEFQVDPDGVTIPFLGESCKACPVEYKHGRVRNEREYNVQLAAQAICLEEMYGLTITKGYIYYTSARQRHEVLIDNTLREYTVKVINDLTEFIREGRPAIAVYKRRCHRCSIYDICSPKSVMVAKYMKGLWKDV